MSGQRSLLSTGARRVALGLLAVAAAVLLAPSAAATPDTDADDAITASWEASGGATGPLGDRQGGVYPVGSAFGQDFAGGKIFFTPATGAHIMQGAILDKYEALGGPADSDLGFPTIDEGPGRLGPDSRNTTFSASDKPVIFWTPDTGPRVVRGAINAAWDKLGGSAGPLGVPSDDEVFRGDVVSQTFTGGELSWNMKDKTFTTVPPQFADQLGGLAVPDDPTSAINTARRAAGGPLGPLGAADGGQYPIGSDGFAQNFAGGKIYYSPETGANVLTGQVLEKYESVGGPEGDLGFPTSSEREGGLGPNSREVAFSADDQPVIFWTPDYGPVIVRGAMNAAWSKLDGAKGPLGAPTADQTEDANVITQHFSGGAITWDKSAHKFTTEPAGLATTLSDLKVPGQDVPVPPAPAQASDSNGDKVFRWHWNWWWLVALIPVLIVGGLVAGAMLRNRRRGNEPDAFDGEDTRPGAAAGGAWGLTGSDQSGGDQSGEGGELGAADSDTELFGAEPDPDSVDTEPTPIQTLPDDDEEPTRIEPVVGQSDGESALVESSGESDEEPTRSEPVVGQSDGEPALVESSGESDEEPTRIEPVVGEPDGEPALVESSGESDEEPTRIEPLVTEFDEEPTRIEPVVGESDEEPTRIEPVVGESDEEPTRIEPLVTEFDEEPTRIEPVATEFEDEPARIEPESGELDEESMLVAPPQEPDEEPTRRMALTAGEADAAALVVPVVAQFDTEPEFPTGRHAAIDVDEPTPGRTAIHLPLEDPHEAPDGYPIKADTRSGLYWSPSNGRYDDAVPEIWFASEELARTNGFVSADSA